MAQKRRYQAPASNSPSKKRKEVPDNASNARFDANKKPKHDHRARQRDARALITQMSNQALQNGALDVDKFVKAREFEMHALEQGIKGSRNALNRRAFQQVPKDLRRRTASHNVKRVPKRLRERGKREMIDDNTPTVTARRRKPTRHMRLRLETAKKLRALGAQRKEKGEEAHKVRVTNVGASKNTSCDEVAQASVERTADVKTRTPRVKKGTLAKPPVPKAKFRKRQIHKAWLPTHIFHAKRAHMPPPSAPLWRFAIPLSPTQKGYRASHRASHERGAVAWDTSYMATIGLEGEQRSLEGVLKALGVGSSDNAPDLWSSKGGKWRRGTRVHHTLVFQRERPHMPIAPVTIIWCVPPIHDNKAVAPEKTKRKLFVRVHPSAFFQLWQEVVRLTKVVKPAVAVEDLRFEIGSIEITGPGSTEALLGALWPSPSLEEGGHSERSVETTWTRLAGVTNANVLPADAMLGFNAQDPRLHHPPHTVKLPTTQQGQELLLEQLASWPIDASQTTPALFDRLSRITGSKLASQKSINRRKSLAAPGEYPKPSPVDPRVPVILFVASSQSKKQQPTWTLLVPWKCVNATWYSLMYYPLSTGQQPRFGGLNEKRQLGFEAGRPWFPGDFPGTEAGWAWEAVERRRRWEKWNKRPKGKRVSWEKVDVGDGNAGEIGAGWACDWEILLGAKGAQGDAANGEPSAGENLANLSHQSGKHVIPTEAPMPAKPHEMFQLTAAQAAPILRSPASTILPKQDLAGKLITVRLTLLNRGVPQTCARIYRLPSPSANTKLRNAWLALQEPKCQGRKHSMPRMPSDAPPHVLQRRLAQSLLQPPQADNEEYPPCPGRGDLLGFVTTGNFNLAEGMGTAIGSLLVEKVADDVRSYGDMGRLCVVRNSGSGVARLARWEVV